MFNWIKKNFKKKQPLVTCYTTVRGLEEIYPPKLAVEAIPEWFKKMPREIMDQWSGHPGTAKKCPAFVDYYKSGVVLYLWCDLWIKINEDTTWEVKTPEKLFSFTNHLDNQFLDHTPKREYAMVLKANSPWRMVTPKGWDLMQLPLHYHFDERFEVLPGVMSADIHYEVNPQMGFKEYGEYLIPRGTPLAMYVPIKREKMTLEVREMDDEMKRLEEKQYYWFSGKFSGGYKEHQRIIKKQEDK